MTSISLELRAMLKKKAKLNSEIEKASGWEERVDGNGGEAPVLREEELWKTFFFQNRIMTAGTNSGLNYFLNQTLSEN